MSLLAKLAAGKTIEIEAEGGSMFPVIRNEDRVRIEPITRPLRRGDIVLLVVKQRWILHRVVQVSEAQVVTQGDNHATPDIPVSLSHAVGRATHSRGRVTIPLDWPAPVGRVWLAVSPLRRLAARLVFR